MSNNRISCCCQVECAYLILKRKVLGLDPVFGSPGINFWGQTFKGYTGPVAKGYDGPNPITDCGQDLNNGLYEHIGISPDYEIWSTPELLASITGDNILWPGSPILEKKDFKYFITGSFILPEKYKELSIGGPDNSVIKNNELYFRYFGGESIDIIKSIKNCFKIKKDDEFTFKVPYVKDGTVCNIDNPDGSYRGVSFDNISGGITSDSNPNEVTQEHIFDIKINYSNKLLNNLTDKNSRIFYSVVEPKQPISGNFDESYCHNYTHISPYSGARKSWCTGVTFAYDQVTDCAIPAKLIDGKSMKYAFYQSIPDSIELYKIDLFRCTDENTNESYLSIGDTDLIKRFRVQSILPKSSKYTGCIQDFCGLTAPNFYPLDGLNARLCSFYAFPPISYSSLSEDDYICEPIKFTEKGQNWSQESCKTHNCKLKPNPGCLDADGNPFFDCLGRVSYTAVWVVENTGYYALIFYGRTSDYTPPPECNAPNSYCVTDEYSVDTCGDYSNDPTFDGRQIWHRFSGYDFAYGLAGSFYVNIPLSVYDCRYWCDPNRPQIQVFNYCTCCCCPGGEPQSTTVSVKTLTPQEITEYEINPYIMIDGNPDYFISPDYILPDFNRYIKKYFSTWKSDRIHLDESVSGYDIFVDNPNCNTGFVSGPGKYFFMNKQKGLTAGTLKRKLCNNINPKQQQEIAVWKSVQNPDYVCDSVYTESPKYSTTCTPNKQHVSFNTLSKTYSKLPADKQPICWKEIINYFPTKEITDKNGITYIGLDGITISDCFDVRSVKFINDTLKYE
jgi:hypothetical protein